jgi:two-component system, NtrC family, nitrogen regulation sensor histidine kinase NtrY
MLQKPHSRTGLYLAILSFLAALVINWFNNYTTAELCERTEKKLRVKEQTAQQGLKWLNDNVKPGRVFSETDVKVSKLFNNKTLSLFAFNLDTLSFWSSNLVPLDIPVRIKEGNGMLHLRNGWYEYFLEEKNGQKNLALIFIKPEYDVQNSYFKNDFVPWLGLPAQTGLRDSITYLPHAVRSINNVPLFEIFLNEPTIKNEKWSDYSLILFFSSVILLLFFVLKRTYNRQVSVMQFSLITIVVVGLRALMVWFKFPGMLYHNALFTPEVYGNSGSFFNEFLGDIILNVILFLMWSLVFFRSVSITVKEGAQKNTLFLIYFAALAGLAIQLDVIIRNLVFNSTIPLEFSNFFNLNPLSFLCLIVVFLNGFSIAVLVEKFNSEYLNDVKRKNIFLPVLILIYGGLYLMFRNKFNYIEWFWLPAVLLVMSLFRAFRFSKNILGIGASVLIFAVITSWLFSSHNSRKERQSMQALSDRLSDRQDAILEGEFSDAARKIKKDPRFRRALYRLPLFGNETEQQLRQNYFTGYFEKYNVQLAVFDSVCMPYFRNSDLLLNNNEYYEDQLKNAIPTIDEHLFFIEENRANTRYIAKLEFDKTENKKAPYILYVQLEPKQFADAGSFPDLLLDEGQQKQNKYKQISYAVYKQNKLVSYYGDYDYPLYNVDSTALRKGRKEFRHYFVSPDKGTLIVLSSREKDFKYFFTTNSYYFLFYSLLGLTLFLISARISGEKVQFFSLDRRIQIFTISILFMALLAVGIFTVRLVIDKSEEDNIDQLTEKATQIHKELDPLLLNNSNLDINGKQYAESVLKKYAALFDTDISLYNSRGSVFASSRPQLFDAGLSSKLINPLAVHKFRINQSSNFNTRDKIGSLDYLSLYTPLYNTSGTFIGYMNLPYFARQSDLEEGLSDYITTLLNVYVVLFLVSLFTGLIVTAYVTKPLRIIQQQLAKISLGKKNEAIHWESNDEIGRLVNEYNRMLLKLEESAALLARSEREGAWQEMAKQVAHEIKNPLTPMKLNLQYLQKVVDDGGTDFAGKFKNVSASIIEQIDTLAHIANEFSHFAKMPKQNLEKVNLTEIILSAIQLFKNDKVKISFHSTSESALLVTADKNQCLRIFNNLIKNAVQAIPGEKVGRIEINVNDQPDLVLVSIKDNGTGIPEEMKEKIFVPNFTTKSTGTGLGLAMVKNIVSSFGGKIWFESKTGEGTIFYLTFQK